MNDFRQERAATLRYLASVRDAWRRRANSENNLVSVVARAKVAVLEGLIDDIEDEVHVKEWRMAR